MQKAHPAISDEDYLAHWCPEAGQQLGFCWTGLTQACCCMPWLHDAWAEVSHSIPLALNKCPLSACCYCFSLDGSYEAISRKQESALSPSAYWTSHVLFSLWGLISQHNLPIDCRPSFQSQVPESPGLDSYFACLYLSPIECSSVAPAWHSWE